MLVDGQPTRSCLTPADSVSGAEITTIETVENDPLAQQVVEVWIDHQVPQCGYCQPGQVIAATALLTRSRNPGEADIAAAMTNLCRCGTYNKMRAAIRSISEV